MKVSEENAMESKTPSIVWWILISSFWIKCANYFSIPFFTIFLTKNTDISLPVIGLLVGIQPFANVMGGFLGGHFSDRLGRRQVLLISLFGTSLAYFGFFILTQLFFDIISIATILFALLNLSAGFFASFFWPVTQALIGDVTSNKKKLLIYRYRYVVANLGGAIGPLLALYLGFAAASHAFLMTSLSYVVFFIVFLKVLKTPENNKQQNSGLQKRNLTQSIQILLADRTLQFLVFSAILFGVAYAQIETNFSQFVYKNFTDGVKFFTYLLAINAFGVALFHPLASFLEKRLSAVTQMILGKIIFCLGCLLMACSVDSKSVLILGIIIITLGEILVVPTFSVLIDKIAPEDLRGVYFGTAIFRQLGPATGPLLGGVFLLNSGPIGLFGLMILAVIISILFVILFEKWQQKNA